MGLLQELAPVKGSDEIIIIPLETIYIYRNKTKDLYDDDVQNIYNIYHA